MHQPFDFWLITFETKTWKGGFRWKGDELYPVDQFAGIVYRRGKTEAVETTRKFRELAHNVQEMRKPRFSGNVSTPSETDLLYADYSGFPYQPHPVPDDRSEEIKQAIAEFAMRYGTITGKAETTLKEWYRGIEVFIDIDDVATAIRLGKSKDFSSRVAKSETRWRYRGRSGRFHTIVSDGDSESGDVEEVIWIDRFESMTWEGRAWLFLAGMINQHVGDKFRLKLNSLRQDAQQFVTRGVLAVSCVNAWRSTVSAIEDISVQKFCIVCGEHPIPDGSRADRETCSPRCKRSLSRQRKRSSPVV
jgi:predicted nucleic acid-binding Zn ribbon protein